MPSDEYYQLLEERIDGLGKQETRRKDADQRKTLDEIFDHSTLLALHKLITNDVIKTLDFPISTGKEGNVYRATGPDGGFLALKIYRTSTATFRNIMKYIDGNPRYRNIGRNRRNIIFTWAKKEYNNLSRLQKHEVTVPGPVHVHRNILAMEFIGNEFGPAPLLRDVEIENPDESFATVIEEYYRLFNDARLVHADLSEYNILVRENGELVLIDLGQCVVHEHPMALEWFRRDIRNISYFFGRRGVAADWKTAARYILEGKEPGSFLERLKQERDPCST